MAVVAKDILAEKLWDKFQILFPDKINIVESYSRTKEKALKLKTRSKNTLIFMCDGYDWMLCTEKYFRKELKK